MFLISSLCSLQFSANVSMIKVATAGEIHSRLERGKSIKFENFHEFYNSYAWIPASIQIALFVDFPSEILRTFIGRPWNDFPISCWLHKSG